MGRDGADVTTASFLRWRKNYVSLNPLAAFSGSYSIPSRSKITILTMTAKEATNLPSLTRGQTKHRFQSVPGRRLAVCLFLCVSYRHSVGHAQCPGASRARWRSGYVVSPSMRSVATKAISSHVERIVWAPHAIARHAALCRLRETIFTDPISDEANID